MVRKSGNYQRKKEWEQDSTKHKQSGERKTGGEKTTKYYKSMQKQLKSRRANSNFGFFIMLLQIKM